MALVEKTVFISYRRTDASWALAVYQNLTHNGYDVFYDYQGLGSGDFGQVIVENIRARAHFLVLLTPSALERTGEPNDWLRREIETALSTRRNIVPLMLEGFDFNAPSIARHLTGSLSGLCRYNALRISPDYFDEAMRRLRERYLAVPVDAVIHPASLPAVRAGVDQQRLASAARSVTAAELTAEQWFERGLQAAEVSQKLYAYGEAIRLKPKFAEAFYNRGSARKAMGDLDGALEDYSESIHLQPGDADAYNVRGIVRDSKGDKDGALKDYAEAMRLNPHLAYPYNNRAIIRRRLGDLDGALKDCDEAIRLKPDYAEAYGKRGHIREAKGDMDGALNDCDERIRLQPDCAVAYLNRADVRMAIGDMDAALKDYGEAIRLKPDYAEAYNNRGIVRDAKGDLEGALSDYDEAIRLKPGLAGAYSNRGSTRKSKGDLEGALKDYDEAIRLQPDFVEAYHGRAGGRRALGNLEGALSDYEKYLELGGGLRLGDQSRVEIIVRELTHRLQDSRLSEQPIR